MITLTTPDGLSPERGIERILQKVAEKLKRDSGKVMENALLHTTRNHFQTIYPGSNNFGQDKVQPGNTSGNVAEVNVYSKGIGRYFHDVTIRPRYREYLTIPMHRSAYGKKAADFNDLFVISKKNGKKFLARIENGSLAFMFVLAKSAFQKQDRRLLPSTKTYSDNIVARIRAYVMQMRV